MQLSFDAQSRLGKYISILAERKQMLSKISYKALGHSIIDPLMFNYCYQKGVEKNRLVCIIDLDKCANPYLIQLTNESHIRFIHDPEIAEYIYRLGLLPKQIHDTSGIYHNFSKPFEIPVWEAEDEHRKNVGAAITKYKDMSNCKVLEDYFNKNNIEPNRYICVHAREVGYSSEISSGSQSFRNTSNEVLRTILKACREYDIKLVRMGRSHMKKIDEPNIVDYASSEIAHPLHDLYLSANCIGWIGDSSGALALGVLFGKPKILINIPYNAIMNHTLGDYVLPLQLYIHYISLLFENYF